MCQQHENGENLQTHSASNVNYNDNNVNESPTSKQQTIEKEAEGNNDNPPVKEDEQDKLLSNENDLKSTKIFLTVEESPNMRNLGRNLSVEAKEITHSLSRAITMTFIDDINILADSEQKK